MMRKKCSCLLSDEHFHLIFLQLTVLDLVNVAHVLYCLLGCVQLLSGGVGPLFLIVCHGFLVFNCCYLLPEMFDPEFGLKL